MVSREPPSVWSTPNQQPGVGGSAWSERKISEKSQVNLDKSIAEALSGRPVAVFDATTDPRLQYPQEAKEEGIATMVAVPMVTKGKVIGSCAW